MPNDTRQGAKPAAWPDMETEWPQVLAIARNDGSPAPRGLCMTRSSCPTRHPPTGGSNPAVRFGCAIKRCHTLRRSRSSIGFVSDVTALGLT